jgi:hypothetical protein
MIHGPAVDALLAEVVSTLGAPQWTLQCLHAYAALEV